MVTLLSWMALMEAGLMKAVGVPIDRTQYANLKFLRLCSHLVGAKCMSSLRMFDVRRYFLVRICSH